MIPIALRILVCSKLEGWRCLDLTGVSFTYEWESPWFTMGRRGFSYSFELPPTAWNQHLLGDIDLMGGTLESVQLPCVVQGLPWGGGIEQRGMLHVESFAPGQIGVRIDLNTPFWDAADTTPLGPMKALGGPGFYHYRKHSDGKATYFCSDVGVPLRWWFEHICKQLGYRLEGPQGQDGFPPVEYFLWWGPKQEETSVGEVLRAVCYRLGWMVIVKVGLNRVYVEDFHGNQHQDGDYYFRNDVVHGEYRRLGRLVNSHRYLLPVAATPRGKLAKLRMPDSNTSTGFLHNQLAEPSVAAYEGDKVTLWASGGGGGPIKRYGQFYSILAMLAWHAPQGTDEECDLFPKHLILWNGQKGEKVKVGIVSPETPWFQDAIINYYNRMPGEFGWAGTFLLRFNFGVGNKCTYEGQLPGYCLKEGICEAAGLQFSYPHGYMRQFLDQSEETTFTAYQEYMKQVYVYPPGVTPPQGPSDPQVPHRPHRPDMVYPPYDKQRPPEPDGGQWEFKPQGRTIVLESVDQAGLHVGHMFEAQVMPEDGVVLLEEGQIVANGDSWHKISGRHGDPSMPGRWNLWAQVPQLLLHHSQRPTETNSYHYPLPRASWYYTALEGTLIEYAPLELLYHIEEFPLPGGSVGEASKALKGNQRVRHMSCTVTETTLTIDEVTAIEQGPYVDLKYEFEHGGSQFELEKGE